MTFKDDDTISKYSDIISSLEDAYNLATNNGEYYNDIGDAIDIAKSRINDLYYSDYRVF